MDNANKNYHEIAEELRPLLDSWWPYIIALIIGILTAIRNYMAGPDCQDDSRIDDKIVIITGASSGLGRETALELARRGGKIILAVRNMKMGEEVVKKIGEIPGAKEAIIREIDLSSLKSVRRFVDELGVDKVDILINNAGVVFNPCEITDEGFEVHFVTNYLGHFLLTQLLLPKLKAAQQGRIINITSQAYSISSIYLDNINLVDKFSAAQAFGQSKLALIMMARYMSKSLKDSNITINAVNPGLIRGTKHMRNSPLIKTFLIRLIMQPFMWLLMKNPVQGAQTIIYAAISSQLNQQSGKYLRDCEVVVPAENALDDEVAEKLYIKSIALVDNCKNNHFDNIECEE